MADYRKHYQAIRSAGAGVVALSVDAPAESEALRVHLALPFPILCDTERRVVWEWGIFNAGEKGGIAKPAVFVIDSSQVVRYAGVDKVVRRVPAAVIVELLRSADHAKAVRRRLYVPLFSDWISAIRNFVRR